MRGTLRRIIVATAAATIALTGLTATSPANALSPMCKRGYYENTAGNCVKKPSKGPGAPSGATAKCRDGSYSYSQSRRGTCSRHGGVSQWL